MQKQVKFPQPELITALLISLLINFLLCGLASVVIATLSHGTTNPSEYFTFSYKFLCTASFSILFFGSLYAFSILITRYLKIKKWNVYIFAPFVVYLNLLFIITQMMMYLEYGEGINPEIYNLFNENGKDTYVYLNNQYHITIWLIILYLPCLGITWIAHTVTPTAGKLFQQKTTLTTLAILMLLAIPGYKLATNRHNFKLKHNLEILSRDPLTSALYIAVSYDLNEDQSYKEEMLPYLNKNESNDYHTAIKIAGADVSAPSPTLSFPRSITDPKSQRPFDFLTKPSHIFYIQLEGHDSILFRDPKLAQISPLLHTFAKTGIYVPNFFPAGLTTNSSTIATFLTFPSIPHRNHNGWLDGKTEQSLPEQLSKLFGYSSEIHSASYYAACSHGPMLNSITNCKLLNYSDNYPIAQWSSIWGIGDDLFVQSIIGQHEPKSPQFTAFMPISNHPPFAVDVHQTGYKNSMLPKSYEPYFTKGGFDPHTRVGHYFFADKEANRLIQHLYQKHPQALFIITADHWSKYSNTPYDPLASYTAPLIFWGPNVIPKNQCKTMHHWYGTHSDILSTLIHLLAEKPLDYHSFGQPLWDQKKNFHCINAVGNNKYIYLTDRGKLYDYRTTEITESPTITRKLLRWHAAMSVIAHKIIHNSNKWQ